MDNPPLTLWVRTREIADLADSSPAVVSNWRKRDPSFPRPASDERGGAPRFRLDEVVAWLRGSGRKVNESSHRRIVCNVAAQQILLVLVAGPSTDPDESIAPVVDLVSAWLTLTDLLGVEHLDIRAAARSVEPEHRELVQAIVQMSDEHAKRLQSLNDAWGPNLTALPSDFREGLHEAFVSYLDRDLHARTLAADFELATLMVGLAVDPSRVTHETVLLDPCSSFGTRLLVAADPQYLIDAVGVESDPIVASVSRRRGYFRGTKFVVEDGESISADPISTLRADAVVVEPPGDPDWRSNDLEQLDRHDPRWIFGFPTTEATMWLQHAVSRLAANGRACVLISEEELAAENTSEIRREMLRQSVLDAILSLPRGIVPNSSKSFALMVLARPGETSDPDKVLMLVGADEFGTALPGDVVIDAVHQASDEYSRWRFEGSIENPRIGVAVSIRELMEPGKPLLPRYWLKAREAQNPDRLNERLEELWNECQFAQWIAFQPADTYPTMLANQAIARRGALGALAGIEILRGNGAPIEGAAPAEAYPMLPEPPIRMPESMLWDLNIGASERDGSQVMGEVKSNPLLTEAGDIVVYSRPSGVFTTVVHDADLLASSRYRIVRVDPTLWNPWFIEACIQASAGSAGWSLPKVDVPLVPIDEQNRLGNLLHELQEQRFVALKYASAVTQIQEVLQEAIWNNRVVPDRYTFGGGDQDGTTAQLCRATPATRQMRSPGGMD